MATICKISKNRLDILRNKDGTEKAVLNTKWTQKGRLGLYELLKANGYLPLIEKEDKAVILTTVN